METQFCAETTGARVAAKQVPTAPLSRGSCTSRAHCPPVISTPWHALFRHLHFLSYIWLTKEATVDARRSSLLTLTPSSFDHFSSPLTRLQLAVWQPSSTLIDILIIFYHFLAILYSRVLHWSAHATSQNGHFAELVHPLTQSVSQPLLPAPSVFFTLWDSTHIDARILAEVSGRIFIFNHASL